MHPIDFNRNMRRSSHSLYFSVGHSPRVSSNAADFVVKISATENQFYFSELVCFNSKHMDFWSSLLMNGSSRTTAIKSAAHESTRTVSYSEFTHAACHSAKLQNAVW